MMGVQDPELSEEQDYKSTEPGLQFILYLSGRETSMGDSSEEQKSSEKLGGL